MKKALILGASGLVGGQLLRLLLADNRYVEIRTLGRKELAIKHQKLKQYTGDLLNMEAHEDVFLGVDDVFVAIGTTRAKTPDREMYEAIDLGIPVAAAKLAKQAGVATFCAVSSMGANAKSKLFYTALKGKMEEAILKLMFPKTVIVRPSLLLGERGEKRVLERFSMYVMRAFSAIIPKKHQAITGENVAKSMIYLANENVEKSIFLNDELHKFAAILPS